MFENYLKTVFTFILVVLISCSPNIKPEPSSKGCTPPIIQYVDSVSGDQVVGTWRLDSLDIYSCNKISDDLFEYYDGQSNALNYILNFTSAGTVENIQGSYAMAIYYRKNETIVGIADCFSCKIFEDASWTIIDNILIVQYPNYSENYIIQTLNDSVFDFINYDEGDYDEDGNLLSFNSKRIRLIKK